MTKLAFLMATVLLGTTTLTAQACEGQEVEATPKTPDLLDTAASAKSFGTLLAAVKAAGLESTLRGKGPFTVFAPTDAAFAALPEGTLQSLLQPANKDRLIAILTYHVVAGRVPADRVVATKSLTSVEGSRLEVLANDDGVTIAGAKVVKTDVAARNGVIHVIDRVVMPPAKPDLVEVAQTAGSFGTLVKALQAAGLVEALRGEGPFTVFAPNDAAFAKLDPATLASLLKEENRAKLQAILKLHVVSGRVEAKTAARMTEAKTLQGQSLKVEAGKDGSLHIGGAKVIAADVGARNGVIHVIDRVLLPR